MHGRWHRIANRLAIRGNALYRAHCREKRVVSADDALMVRAAMHKVAVLCRRGPFKYSTTSSGVGGRGRHVPFRLACRAGKDAKMVPDTKFVR